MDYDGDGDVDLVTGSDDCCNRKGEFFLFRRGADGRFRAREAIATQEPGFPLRTRVYVADWDRDGRLDLIVDKSHILLAPGPLADRAKVKVSGRIEGSDPPGTFQTKPNIADWDGDGRPDLVVGVSKRGEKGIYRLCGVDDAESSQLAAPERRLLKFLKLPLSDAEGPRLAAPERVIAAPDGARVTGLDVADWDGDGVLDLIAGLIWRKQIEPYRWKSRSQVWVYRRRPPD